MHDLSRLFLARRLDFKKSESGRVLAVGERECYFLSDVGAQLVADLLGGKSWTVIVEKLISKFGQDEALRAIRQLIAQRILLTRDSAITRDSAVDRATASFEEILGKALRPAEVQLRGIGQVDLDPLRRILEADGHRVVTGEGQLLVISTSDYLHPDLDELDNRAEPWLIVKATGRRIWLGPVFVRGHGICRPCLKHWLQLHRWGQASESSMEEPSPAALPSTLATAGALLATAVSELVSGHDPAKLNLTILTFDTISFGLERHPIANLPGCPRCKAQAQPQLAALASDVTGILERVEAAPSPTGAGALALAHACLPLPINCSRLPQAPFSVGGQGRSLVEAKENCLYEGIERYSATFRGDERLNIGKYPREVALSELLHFSARQYEDRELWNAHTGDARGVPEPCNKNQIKRWCEVRSAIDGQNATAPAGYVYLWYPFQGEPRYNYANTNGCAAGRTREQALLHGLLELVERDALAIWWYNRLNRPAFDWRAWRDEELDSIGSALKQEGRELALLNLTHDLDIPVVAAIAPDSTGRRIYFGAAARTCPLQAARAASRELLQFWYWGERGRNSPDKALWLENSSLQRHPYLTASTMIAPGDPVPLSTQHSLQRVVSSLHSRRLIPYYADLTRTEIGVPVVRAIVPGLRHHGPRLAPGRLYDVPVELGWLERPQAEEEMNTEACVL